MLLFTSNMPFYVEWHYLTCNGFLLYHKQSDESTSKTRMPKEMSNEKMAMTVAEAAHLLGISRGLAYEMARRGKLPAIRFGKRILVPRVALERLLEQPLSQGTSFNNSGGLVRD